MSGQADVPIPDRFTDRLAALERLLGDAPQSGTGCGYCDGLRCDCTCETDCGARAEDNGHVCGQAPAEVRAAWLRSFGTYTEEEIARYAGR